MYFILFHNSNLPGVNIREAGFATGTVFLKKEENRKVRLAS
jgi:hypothetical protein